jgi:transcriptional regulator with XRE-family HTH domain
MIERGWSKLELSKRSGISYPYICDLVRGVGNPSIKTLEALAKAFGIEAPRLLEPYANDTWIGDAIELPPGYERVSAILPTFDAYLVKKKAMETQTKLDRIRSKMNKKTKRRKKLKDDDL